jgi:hypothetical protein
MAQVHLLFANKTYDTAKQAVEKNQVIRMEGYDYDRYVVYNITEGHSGLIYRLINLRTREFGQCDLIRPLSEKFGIGYYFDDTNPQFMDAFEVIIVRDEAERIAGEKRKERQATATDNTPEKVTGDFLIVDYSEKALAVFGDTRPMKDELKALGGRFNPKLTHNEQKKAGWIFSKSKEQELMNLLTVK